MKRYYHFRCRDCIVRYGVRVADGLPPARPRCRRCGKKARRAGPGAKRLSPKAIELTGAGMSRASLPTRSAVAQALRMADAEARRKEALAAAIGEDTDAEEEEDELSDPSFEPPARTFNIHMRLSPASYVAVPGRTTDSTFLLSSQWCPVRGTAGRLNLKAEMGRVFGVPTITAAEVHGTQPWTTAKKFKSSEWCHLVADSLGGPSVAANLVAASFSANTFMAAIEVLLKGRTEVAVKVEAHCSTEHCAEYIVYKMKHRSGQGAKHTYQIDARAEHFSQADLTSVQDGVSRWLRSVGL